MTSKALSDSSRIGNDSKVQSDNKSTGKHSITRLPRHNSTSQSTTPMKPAIRNRRDSVNCQSTESDETLAWRKHGMEKREELLRKDEIDGGSDFVINRQSKLKSYYEIADRVLDQFHSAYQSPNKLEETYLMGNRLVKFLSVVLRTHHHYYSKDPVLTRLRIKSQNDLEQVRIQLDDVAFKLDEMIYNVHIANAEDQGMGDNTVESLSVPNAANTSIRSGKKVTFAPQTTSKQSQFDKEKHLFPSAPLQDDNAWFSMSSSESSSPTSIAHASTTWSEEMPDLSFSSASSHSSTASRTSPLNTSLHSLQPNERQRDKPKDNISAENSDFATTESPLSEDSSSFFTPSSDDGWEHFETWKESDGGWPDMLPIDENVSSPMFEEKKIKEQHQLEESLKEGRKQSPMKPTRLYQDEPVTSKNMLECNDGSHTKDVNLSSSSQETEDSFTSNSDSDFDETDDDSFSVGDELLDELDEMSQEDMTFIEKIARENFCHDMDELYENDEDSDAVDSWAQGDSYDSDGKGSDDECVDNSRNGVGDINGEGTSSHSLGKKDGKEDVEQNTVKEKHLNCQQLEHDEGESKQNLMFSSQTDFMLNREKGPQNSFEESDEETEHEEFVKSMTELEFSDDSTRCDSSGGDKTTTTAETEAMTVDDDTDSECSSVKHPEDDTSKGELNEADAVLGIARRNDYIPTLKDMEFNDSEDEDNPEMSESNWGQKTHQLKNVDTKNTTRNHVNPNASPPNKTLPSKLDYLEFKVKDLQEKRELQSKHSFPSSSRPQMHRKHSSPLLAKNMSDSDSSVPVKHRAVELESQVMSGGSPIPPVLKELMHKRNSPSWKKSSMSLQRSPKREEVMPEQSATKMSPRNNDSRQKMKALNFNVPSETSSDVQSVQTFRSSPRRLFHRSDMKSSLESSPDLSKSRGPPPEKQDPLKETSNFNKSSNPLEKTEELSKSPQRRKTLTKEILKLRRNVSLPVGSPDSSSSRKSLTPSPKKKIQADTGWMRRESEFDKENPASSSNELLSKPLALKPNGMSINSDMKSPSEKIVSEHEKHLPGEVLQSKEESNISIVHAGSSTKSYTSRSLKTARLKQIKNKPAWKRRHAVATSRSDADTVDF